MFTPAPPPFASYDVTEACRALNSEAEFRMLCLWPFKLTVTAFPTGSRIYQIEFRPFWKFALTFGVFWKAKQ